MQFRESFLLIQRQSLIRGRDGRSVGYRFLERRDDVCDYVVHGCACAEAVEFDDVAEDEGGVGVVDEVFGVGCEELERARVKKTNRGKC